MGFYFRGVICIRLFVKWYYGKSPNLSSSPREALAQEVWDVRSIYFRQGLYNREIRKSLQGLITLNKLSWQGIFDKLGRNP